MSVTWVAKRVRNSASSMAESPPPITVISLPEKKNPSQVAQDDTPCPISACSLGSPAGDDQGFGLNGFLAQGESKRAFAQVGLGQVPGADISAEADGLSLHVL